MYVILRYAFSDGVDVCVIMRVVFVMTSMNGLDNCRHNFV